MKDFLGGLTEEEQEKYKQLDKKFMEEEDFDQKKKLIPHLTLLREKGLYELRKENDS